MTKGSEWIALINQAVEKNKIDVVLPVSEDGFTALVKHKQLISNPEKLVYLASWESFQTANNKWLLAKHMEKFKISFPNSVLVPKGKYDGMAMEKINYPILVKPINNTSSGDGIVKVNDKKELLHYFKSKGTSRDQLIQEYIKGYDLGCNVLCKAGKILAFTIQKGNLWGPKRFSAQTGLDFVDEPEVYEIVKKLMKSLHWSGVANVDMRFDAENGIFKVLEINPRFWGTLNGSLVAGVNFPHLFCLTAMDQQFDVPIYQRISYLKMEGLKQHILMKKSFLFRFSYIWNHTPIRYVLKDPAPTAFGLLKRIKDIILLRVGTPTHDA